MHAVKKQAVFAKQHGLFRAASASNVVSNLLAVMLNLDHCSDNTSYDSLPQVSRVDYFISHSWSCPCWMKSLAFCHFLNFDLAIVSSCMACLFAVLILFLHAGSFSGVATQPQGLLYGCLLCWPVAVFLAVYLFAHIGARTTFWFDRICVNQIDETVKAQTLQAIPAFVAQSTQMLVLWDDTYFDRLWCQYELSVHAKTAASPLAMKLVPMWISLWTLSWISLYTMVNFLCLGQTSSQLDLESRRTLFTSMVDASFVPPFVYLLTAFPFSWFCIQKLKSHKLMLDQMAHFDLRNAKCSVESDRKIIEEQVLQLFDEALEPPLSVAFDESDMIDTFEPFFSMQVQGSRFDLNENSNESVVLLDTLREIRHITSYPTSSEIIDQFNSYVRGPLRDSVVNSMGKEEFISFKSCVVVSFPWWFQGLISVLGCDARADCETSAVYGGYQSVEVYMATNAVMRLFLGPFVNALSYPLMLRTNKLVGTLVSDTYVHLILGSFCSAMVAFLLDHLGLHLCGMLVVVVTKYSHVWLAGLIAGLTCLFGASWFLFRQRPQRISQRSQRCFGETWCKQLPSIRADTKSIVICMWFAEKGLHCAVALINFVWRCYVVLGGSRILCWKLKGFGSFGSLWRLWWSPLSTLYLRSPLTIILDSRTGPMAAFARRFGPRRIPRGVVDSCGGFGIGVFEQKWKKTNEKNEVLFGQILVEDLAHLLGADPHLAWCHGEIHCSGHWPSPMESWWRTDWE